jgi:hypothetical protein
MKYCQYAPLSGVLRIHRVPVTSAIRAATLGRKRGSRPARAARPWPPSWGVWSGQAKAAVQRRLTCRAALGPRNAGLKKEGGLQARGLQPFTRAPSPVYAWLTAASLPNRRPDGAMFGYPKRHSRRARRQPSLAVPWPSAVNARKSGFERGDGRNKSPYNDVKES